MKQRKAVLMVGALVLIISAVLTVGGCKHSNNPVPVTGVSLDKTEHKLARKSNGCSCKCSRARRNMGIGQ